MEASATNQEIRSTLLRTIREKDLVQSDLAQARAELKLAKACIIELENQNIEFDRLLTNVHAAIQVIDKKPLVAPSKTTWIGNWLSSPMEYPAFVQIEDLWQKGYLQQALSRMPSLLQRNDFGNCHRANARLLYSALIQNSGSNIKTALLYAEEGLQIAAEARLHELTSKAQFQRGLCYLYLCEYAHARWCFVLASHLDGHAQMIDEFKHKAECSMKSFPEGHPARNVSPDFNYFCNFAMDQFVQGV